MPKKSTTKVEKDSKKTSTAAKKPAATKKSSTATKTKAAATAKSKPAAKKATTTKKAATTTTTAKKSTAAKKPAATTAKKSTATKKPASEKKSAGASVAKPKKQAPAAKQSSSRVTQKKEKAVTESVVLVEPTPVEDLPAKPIVFGDIVIDPYPIDHREEYMNSKQKEHFIEILLAWKKALMEEVDRTMSLLQGEVKNLPDITDRASQDEEFSVALRTRDRERKLIKKIDSTLARIRKDDYGFCDSCGIEIGIRRLEARPTANLCIDCKTLDEIVEKQTRG